MLRATTTQWELAQPKTDLEASLQTWDTFLQIAKMWDLLISKAMLALCFWNVMVAGTGLTFLEYKNNAELNMAA